MPRKGKTNGAGPAKKRVEPAARKAVVTVPKHKETLVFSGEPKGSKGKNNNKKPVAVKTAPVKQATHPASATVAKTAVDGKGSYWGDIGAAAGRGLGDVVSAFVGQGSYRVQQNSLKGRVNIMGNSPPVVNGASTFGGQATTMCHREYIGDLIAGPASSSGSTEFTVSRMQINPGNRTLFPWLAMIAANFQHWRLLGAVMCLISETTPFSAESTNVGFVAAAVNSDPTCETPIDKLDMLNLQNAESGAPYRNLMLGVECKRDVSQQTKLFVAVDGDYGGTQSPMNFDFGTLFIASGSLPEEAALTKICEVWFCYEVALFKPVLRAALPYGNGVKFNLYQARYQDDDMLPLGQDSARSIATWSNPAFTVKTINNEAGTEQYVSFPEGNNNWLVLYHVYFIAPQIATEIPVMDVSLLNGEKVLAEFADNTGMNANDYAWLAATTGDGDPWVGYTQISQAWMIASRGADVMQIVRADGQTAEFPTGYGELWIIQLPEDSSLNPVTLSKTSKHCRPSVRPWTIERTSEIQEKFRAKRLGKTYLEAKTYVETHETENRLILERQMRKYVEDLLSGYNLTPTEEELKPKGGVRRSLPPLRTM